MTIYDILKDTSQNMWRKSLIIQNGMPDYTFDIISRGREEISPLKKMYMKTAKM